MLLPIRDRLPPPRRGYRAPLPAIRQPRPRCPARTHRARRVSSPAAAAPRSTPGAPCASPPSAPPAPPARAPPTWPREPAARITWRRRPALAGQSAPAEPLRLGVRPNERPQGALAPPPACSRPGAPP